MTLTEAIDKIDPSDLRMILKAIVKEFPLIAEQLKKAIKESR
jgi:hypothetical protein